ncbi:hypothetical protein I6M54_21180 [Shewanella algae]|uniref:DUF3147 family protein n=1 Tax=Shewanella algae TaxID=38313 RepID=A0AAD1KD74_9GAMM|nr:hypothetical protein [Shewanella algae]MBO2597332.1 hypothetical protein [Shewanella algae]MBO2668684.1 hypothetical protein [Shewanella algae]BCV47204.1 hypothetical protein TUM17379_42220 [Shewanella algae]
MDSLLLAKIATAIIAVVGLSLVAERVSPRVAGILSGYPLGTAIALFFIGIELGEPFAAASATAALSGFIASLLLICGYALGIRLGGERPLPLVALLGSGLGLLAFGLSGYLLSLLNLNLLGGSLALLLAIVLVGLVLAKIPDATVAKPVRLSPLVLLLRAAAAAIIVLLVTAAAKLLTPAQAGILAAFPITLYPFLLIIHLAYGAPQAQTIIKHYPRGLGSLMCYVIAVSWLYPLLGIAWGTALAFVVATLYLLVLSVWHRLRTKPLETPAPEPTKCSR